jgi:23S rRNA (uracil1939-C5)-methyltransferase
MELEAGALVAGGDAIGRMPSGKVIFVDGALPGERVEVELTDTRKDYARASVRRVIEPSSDRVVPPCPHVIAGCGGCRWQHLSPEAQYRSKVRIAVESLARIARIPVSEDFVARASTGAHIPSIGYRTTVRLAFDADGRPGFRERSTNRVVAVDTCLVAHPLLQRAIAALSARRGSGAEVTLRCSTTTEVVGAVVHGDESDVQGLDHVDVVGDAARLVETVRDTDIVVSMGSFFQSGVHAAEVLVDTVLRVAGPEALSGAFGQVVDAYGGVGLFAATIVPTHVPVTLVESNSYAVGDARHNLGSHRATVVESLFEDWHALPAGLVIADPARTGLGAPGVSVLAATRAPVVVLVSCDAAAGARDARLLAELGYELDDLVVLDLFPHTHHLEMVMRFRRASVADESRPVTRSVGGAVPPAA